MVYARTGAAFTAALLLAGISGAPDAGNAGTRYYDHNHGPVYRHVRAESRYSSRAVVAPVRRGPVGDQVMTPGGNWYDCEITCEYTLRRVYLDFWETMGPDEPTYPGYFRFKFVLD
jgi:hypothetical protein